MDESRGIYCDCRKRGAKELRPKKNAKYFFFLKMREKIEVKVIVSSGLLVISSAIVVMLSSNQVLFANTTFFPGGAV